MPLWFNKCLDLQPQEIIYAAKHASTRGDVADILGVSFMTIYRYATTLTHPETNEKLSDWLNDTLKKNRQKRKMDNKPTGKFRKITAFDVLNGRHPNINKDKFRDLLIRDGIFEEKCNICGFDERRILDYQVPLVLIWKDGDLNNHSMNNLELICYNCFFLNYAEFEMKAQKKTFNRLYEPKL